MQRSQTAWLALGVLWTIAGTARGQEETDVARRFLIEAPPAWRAYLRFAGTLQGGILFRSYSPGPERKPVFGPWLSYCIEFKQSPLGSVLWFQRDLEPSEADLSIRHGEPTYAFPMLARNARHAQIYRVVDGEASATEGNAEEIRARALKAAAAGLNPYALWLPEALNNPAFIVRAARLEAKTGVPLCTVDFEFPHRSTNRALDKRGSLTFDPAQDWLVTAYTLYLGPKYHVDGAFTYRRSDSGHAIPVSLKEQNHWDEVADTEWEYQLFEQPVMPESEFVSPAGTLGRGQADQANAGEGADWWWAALATLGMVLLALVLQRRARACRLKQAPRA